MRDLGRRFALLMPTLRVANPPVVFILGNKVDKIEQLGDSDHLRDNESDVEDNNSDIDIGDRKCLKERPSKGELDRELSILIDTVNKQLLEGVLDSQKIRNTNEGLVSCYVVSAKSGRNCKEVVEQLQLRIAYRQLYLSRTGKRVMTKASVHIGEGNRGWRSTNNGRLDCCQG